MKNIILCSILIFSILLVATSGFTSSSAQVSSHVVINEIDTNPPSTVEFHAVNESIDAGQNRIENSKSSIFFLNFHALRDGFIQPRLSTNPMKLMDNQPNAAPLGP